MLNQSREELLELEKEEIVDLLLGVIVVMGEKITELEGRLNQTSQNSSKAPSSDIWKVPKASRKKSGKSPGGQAGHKGHFLRIDQEPDAVIELKSGQCVNCGENLLEIGGSSIETRDVVEVEIRTKVTRYAQMEVLCPCCSVRNREEFPDGINSQVQYGEGVRSIVVLLTNYANVSYDKTQKILNDVLEVPISTGTLVNHVNEFGEKSEELLREIKSRVKQGTVGHFDETSVRVNGKKHWLHTAGNAEATYNTVHGSRGIAGTDDNGVLREFGGVAVHDCLIQYFGYGNCEHAVCNAHLLRELQGVIENRGQVWAVEMSKLLHEMKKAVDDFVEDGNHTSLPAEYLKWFSDSYDVIIKMGEDENPLTEEQQQKVKKKRSKPRNLLDRFILYRREITRFAEDFAVPFTNNMAERSIRNAKVKQKVSGGFRSEAGAKNFAKISSVIDTATKQGLGVFKTVSQVFAGSLPSIFNDAQPVD
jgi:transposase